MRFLAALFILFFSAFGSRTKAQDNTRNSETTLVYVFDIKTEIGPPAWRQTQEAVKAAEKAGADILFLDLDTYGGRVDMADSIRTKLLRSEIPVYVLINNNAASAGALISISCDSIYMTPGATIGAATVVNEQGEVVPDKYQSYMRSKMRATAEETGRDPNIAEAMVDPDKEVAGISVKGKVLTFTIEDAIRHGYCQGEASTIKEALKLSGIKKYKIEKYRPGIIDKIIGILINPAVSGILIMLMLGGIYFELQSPGVGFPLVAAITAAIIFFAPYYLEGMAENWEVIIFIVGVILVALEIFVVPGFGITGISGITLMFAGLSLSMIGNIGFDFTFVPPTDIITPLLVVTLASLLFMILLLFLLPKLFHSGALSFLVLKESQKVQAGYLGVNIKEKSMIGLTGTAFTDLRPAGKILINDVIYDAYAKEGYLEKGAEILVIDYENAQLGVRQFKEAT